MCRCLFVYHFPIYSRLTNGKVLLIWSFSIYILYITNSIFPDKSSSVFYGCNTKQIWVLSMCKATEKRLIKRKPNWRDISAF